MEEENDGGGLSPAEEAVLTRERATTSVSAYSTASALSSSSGSGSADRGRNRTSSPGAKTVSGGWRLVSALLFAAACALIGGAIAVDRKELDFAPALLWGIWNLGLTLAVIVTHVRRLSKRPLTPVTIKRLLLVACVSLMATVWALPIHIYAATLNPVPANFEGTTSRVMTAIACGCTLVMALVLAMLTKSLHRAERQSRYAHTAFMVYYVLAALGAIAAAAVAFAEDFVTEAGGVAVAVALVIIVIAVENRYRYVRFVTNRPVHNHLVPMAALGWTTLVTGYAAATFEAVRIVRALVGDSTLTVAASPYLQACVAGLWLYRWAFSLIWTVAFYAATEGNTERFLESSGSRFAAGLFGFAARPPASTGLGVGASGQARDLTAGGSDDGDDVDDLDALLLSDDEFVP